MPKIKIQLEAEKLRKKLNLKDGVDGVDGLNGKDGRDGKNGINGKDGISGKDGRDGVDGINGLDGLDGKDGSADTRIQIVEKINTGTKDDSKINLFQIEGFDTLITKPHLDRAISILDQRTQFLINKVNNISGSSVWGGITGTLSDQTDLQTALNAKENSITAGTSAQYWRGDKTFQTLNTLAVPELTNLYFTNARAIESVLTGYVSGAGTVSATDTILQAIQKLNGNVSALVTGVSSVNGLTGAVALTGTANRITVSAANVLDISASYVGQSSITTLGTIGTGTWQGTVITGTYGGTGVNNGLKTFTYLKNISFTAADDTGVYTLPTGTKTLVATDVATLSSLTSIGTIGTGVWQGTKIGLAYGGTNADLSATGGAGNYLKQVSAGAAITVGTIPASDIASAGDLTRTSDTNVTLTLGGTPTGALLKATSLTLGWSGQLAETRGGTNQSTYTTGDILYASASNTLSKLAGNITTTRKFLRQTGNGSVSAAPAWDTILAADVPGSALTKTDDTNVTLTLGGSASTALLNAASLTLGWTGTLAVSRGGNGTGTYVLGDLLYSDVANSLARLAGNITTTKKFLTQTGGGAASAAPGWNTIVAGDLPSLDGITAPAADVSLNSHKITNLADPTAATDAVNLQTMQTIGLKTRVRAATIIALPANSRTSNVITASANGAITTQDGITLVAGDRLLVKNEATGANNGIYSVTTVGDAGTKFVLTRTTDADTSAKFLADTLVMVAEGTTLADTLWVLTTNDTVTLNTTSLTFLQIAGNNTLVGTGAVIVSGMNISINSNGITDAMIRQSAACSVIGRSANSLGNVADISIGSDNQFLVRRAGVLQGATLVIGDLPSLTGLTATDIDVADEVPIYDASAAANKKVTVQRLGGYLDPGICQGRLTLTTGTAVTTADVTGATNVFFTPFKGDRVALYDGTRWNEYVFTELTLALGTLVNSQAYDVFLYDNAGTLTLEALEWANSTITMTIATPCVVTWTAHGLSSGDIVNFTNSGGALPTGVTANTNYWITKIDANTFNLSTTAALQAAGTLVATSGSQSGTHTGHEATTRKTALTTQNGVYVKSGDTTRRYLGTFRTTATTTTEDSLTKRLLYNYYNRCHRALIKTGSSVHAYATGTWREWNADATAMIEIMLGIREDVPILTIGGSVYGGAGYLSFALDTASVGTSPNTRSSASTNESGQARTWEIGLGYHYIKAMEFGAASFNCDTFILTGGIWA